MEKELEIQNNYINKILDINSFYFKKTGYTKKFYIATFGCQMNAHDSEKLEGMLVSMGYEKIEDEKTADLIVYNTCCVRENAENKVYGNLGYLKKIKEEKKDLKIILCGCMMQQHTVIQKIKKSYNCVNIIFGTFNLYRFPELLYTNIETNEMIIDVWDEHDKIVEDLPIIRRYPFKASVNIMYGCNNFCSYCIVPYVRGRERSREIKDILNEITTLADNGVKEIMLLGQNVNSYGKTLSKNTSFAKLLDEVSKINSIERIRFMTSHPKDLSDELIYIIRDNDKICNYIHLPFQAGSTKILNKMNRGYTKEEYLYLINKIKTQIPNIGLTTDIIVGFPEETEEDFQHTLDIVKNVEFNSAFTFLYSKRIGTPAYSMDNHIAEDIVKDRFNRLLEVVNSISMKKNKEQIGLISQVLVEGLSGNDDNFLTGRLDNNSLIHFKGAKKYIGKLVDVKIIDCKTFYLTGELL